MNSRLESVFVEKIHQEGPLIRLFFAYKTERCVFENMSNTGEVERTLTLILPTWRIWWAPNASK